jgi:hypothetical protein
MTKSEQVATVALVAFVVIGGASIWRVEREPESTLPELRSPAYAPKASEEGTPSSAPPDSSVCRPELDPKRLARLAKNALAEPPSHQTGQGEDFQNYFYPSQGCGEVQLNVSRMNRKVWSFSCDTTCSRPQFADLGSQEHLVNSDFTTFNGVKVSTRWYLIKSGPLANNVVSFTESGFEPGVEVVIDSPGSIQYFHTDFISDWLCENRPNVHGFDRSRCSH